MFTQSLCEIFTFNKGCVLQINNVLTRPLNMKHFVGTQVYYMDPCSLLLQSTRF